MCLTCYILPCFTNNGVESVVSLYDVTFIGRHPIPSDQFHFSSNTFLSFEGELTTKSCIQNNISVQTLTCR